jgi:hypothetical protein
LFDVRLISAALRFAFLMIEAGVPSRTLAFDAPILVRKFYMKIPHLILRVEFLALNAT